MNLTFPRLDLDVQSYHSEAEYIFVVDGKIELLNGFFSHIVKLKLYFVSLALVENMPVLNRDL